MYAGRRLMCLKNTRRKWIVIICYGVIYLAVSIGIAYTLNYWRLFIIYGYEIVAIFVVVFGFRMLQKNERVQ